MIRFKNQLKIKKTRFKTTEGFTFAEVIMALAIIAIMIPTIFGLAGSLMRSTYKSHNTFENTVLMKNIFWQARQEGTQKDFERNIEEPVLKLKYKLQQVKNEKLKKFKNLFVALVQAQWQEFNLERTDSMSTLITKEQKKTETKK